MSSNSRAIGTLIAVVLKANHLPNKRHIGKQDPYCVVTVNGEKRRTKAIKRGGQHPEWDEEIRFTLIEDTETSDQTTQKSDGSPHPPPKPSRGPKKIKGGLNMKVACFADDPREPDFIGEADVDLTEVLTKGETDEWFTLTNKDKFAGKVYLELTFWSNEPPPEKKNSKPQKTKYAGPGYFNPSEEHPHPTHVVSQSRISSAPEHSRLSDSVSSVLRVPNPNAQSELLYDPPYVQRHRVSPVDRVSNDFGELDVADRRSSHSGHLTSSISSGYTATIPQPAHSFDFSASESTYVKPYEQSAIPHGSTQPQQSVGVPNVLLPGYSQAQDPMPASGYPQSNRRHRIPTSSSGFVPLHGSNSLPSHPSEPTSLPSYSTTLTTHNSHYPTQTYTSVLSHAQPPTTFVQATTPPFNPQPYPVSQPTQYSHYAQVISMPTPNIPSVGSYINSQAPAPPAPHNTTYVNGNTPSPTHDQTIQPLHAQTPVNAGSRPLPPQPQINFGQSRVSGVYTATQAVSPQQTVQQSNVAYQATPFPPQPPPPPPINYSGQSYSTEPQSIVPPPPPPLESEQSKARARRRSSLPRPPVNYVQSDIPPPPPLPTNGYLQGQLPPPPPPPVQNGQAQFSHPGPPPKPPVMIDNTPQWLPSYNSPPLQNGYGHAV